MLIDGEPQWYMTGVARAGGGVRVYASRELISADVDVTEVSHEPVTRLSAAGRNVLIIDGPDYPWVLARIQQIWSGNPRPGWTPGPRTRSPLDDGMPPGYPRPMVSPGSPAGRRLTSGTPDHYPRAGDSIRIEMTMGNPTAHRPAPALPDGYGGDGYALPPAAPRSRPIPLERAPSPVLKHQPLAIEAPGGDDGE